MEYKIADRITIDSVICNGKAGDKKEEDHPTNYYGVPGRRIVWDVVINKIPDLQKKS